MAFLGLSGTPGLSFLNNIDFSGFIAKMGFFGQMLFIVVLIGSIVGAFLYLRSFKKSYSKSIHIFEEIHNDFVPLEDDVAIEILIPNTAVKVFYLKKNKIYLPRPTRAMGKDHYWFGIRKNREWVNFTMKNLNETMKEADLDFDHSDMRYANAQLKKLIERNYKKEKWWQTYRNEMGMAILILMLTFSMWFVLGKVGSLIGQLSPLIEATNQNYALQEKVLGALDNICSQSGIRTG